MTQAPIPQVPNFLPSLEAPDGRVYETDEGRCTADLVDEAVDAQAAVMALHVHRDRLAEALKETEARLDAWQRARRHLRGMVLARLGVEDPFTGGPLQGRL